MKTLKFISMPVSGHGGTETVLTKVLNQLNKENKYNIILYLTQQPTKTWLNSFNDNIEIHICSNNKLMKLFYFTKIFVKATNDDHFIILGANIIPFANKMRKLFKKSFHITSWIHYSLVNQNLFNPEVLLQADDHWAISSSIKDKLLDMGVSKENIHLIFNPIERQTETIKPNSNKQTKLVYVGRLELQRQKNLQELFNFLKDNNNVLVDLFGKADNEEALKNKINELNIDNQVNIHSWTSQPWKVIKGLHPNALILTSNFEGLPMVSLEAMSYGLPCILASFKGAEDVIKPSINGFIYKQHDLIDLRNKLQQLQDTDISQSAVKQSIDKFYFKNYFSHLNNVLDSY